MYKYILSGSINGKYIREKAFISRAQAMTKLDRLLNKYNLQVEEDYFGKTHHDEKFVCNTYNFFEISREAI